MPVLPHWLTVDGIGISTNSKRSSWTSYEKPTYPIRLYLGFAQHQVQEIRILCHQDKTPRTCTVFVNNGNTEQRLGQYTFDTVSRRGSNDCELKFIPIRQRCNCIIIQIDSCITDQFNPSSEVSILGLIVTGDEEEQQNSFLNQHAHARSPKFKIMRQPSVTTTHIESAIDYISTYMESSEHQYSSKIYAQNREYFKLVRKRINVLEKAKTKAVAEENFERASEIKSELQTLFAQINQIKQKIDNHEFEKIEECDETHEETRVTERRPSVPTLKPSVLKVPGLVPLTNEHKTTEMNDEIQDDNSSEDANYSRKP